MKKILLSSGFLFLVLIAYSQQSFWLDVQPGKLIMPGDGVDYTTLVIAARDSEGEVITSMSGRVKIRVSSGFIDDTVAQMNEGVAMVRFTSPMFGTPVKSSQRMVYFMFKFMQKFVARSAGSTNTAANQRLATEVAMETMKEGLNPIALIPTKQGDNNVYIVCELNGVKGKAKIQINKETDSPNGNIIPGVYYGFDITGQSEWMLEIQGGGQGYFGEASGNEQNANTILFTNENFTEFNDAMGKMAGMSGFMKAYLGPPESETKYLENFNIREQGMPSAYMPMPKNGVFVYIPPILFEYAGRRSQSTTDDPSNNQEEIKFEKSGIVFSQKEVVGDGRSRTKAVFHYEDENGVPVAGKSFTWDIPKGLKVISMQSVTDASGNAVAELEVPVVKAGEEKRGENTGGLIENYELFPVKVNYTSAKGKSESTTSNLTVFKTLEQDLYILKAGMEPFPYKVLLPQLEYYNLESSIFALLPENFMTVPNQKTAVNDAMVFVGSRNFDKAEFQRLMDMYFKKDRQLLITFLENEKGGFSAVTDANGKFKLIIRDFEGKKRLYSGGYDRKVIIEPLEAKIADLTGRRKGALTEVLGLLSAGADASGNTAADDGTFTGQGMNALDYKEKVYKQLFEMERSLCTGSHNEAIYIEEKLHIIGMLMTNAKGTARFMGDTGKEVIENGWELLGMAWEYANEKFKITEKLSQKVGLDKVGDSLARLGMKFELAAWSKVLGKDQKHGTKRIILEQIKKYVLASDAPNKNKASAAYYRMMGQAADAISGEVWDALTGGISDALSDANPVPDMIVGALRNQFYAGLRGEVDKFMAQPPEKVHAVYPQLQIALRDRSTEIRSYYQDIAASRFNWEMYKADIDLFRDVVVKGAIIIYDVKTLNWAKVKDHLDNLEKFNKATDAAYTATRFAQELWRYKNLWQEATAAFHYANRSISQGVLVSEIPYEESNFSLFTEAHAASAYGSNVPPAVSVIASADLKLQNGALPIDQINKVISAGNAHLAWMDSQNNKLTLLNGFHPDVAGKLYQSSNNFEDELTRLVVSVLAYGQNQSASNRKVYETSASKLKSEGTVLAGVAGQAQIAMDEIPETIQVPVEAAEANGEVKLWNNPLYLKIAGGALSAILLTFIIWWVIRRRKSRHSGVSQQGRPMAPIPTASASTFVNPPAPAPRAAPPDAPIPGPRFCPSCGNALTPGARFCKKCGKKVG